MRTPALPPLPPRLRPDAGRHTASSAISGDAKNSTSGTRANAANHDVSAAPAAAARFPSSISPMIVPSVAPTPANAAARARQPSSR